MTLRAFRWRHPVGLTAAFVLVALEGCSLFFDLNTTQCEVTPDCRNLGPQFATTICVNRVCVETEPNGSGGASGGASPNGGRGGASGTGGAGVVEGGAGGSTPEGGAAGSGEGGMPGTGGGGSGGKGGSAGSGGTVEPPECVTNKDCIEANQQQAYMCKESKCLPLINTACPLLLPRSDALDMLSEPSPIILGGFASVADQVTWDSQATVNWDLALKEFQDATGGGLPAKGGGKQRPVLALICNGMAEDVDPAMEHLTAVGVPAVLSTLDPDQLHDAFNYTRTPEYLEAEHPAVAFVSTGSADLRLANLSDDGLIWHMLDDPRGLAATTAALVRRIEPFVNHQRQMNSDTVGGGFDDPDVVPLRVTLVYSDEPTMRDAAAVLTRFSTVIEDNTLVFNGKSALDNGDDFKMVEIPKNSSGQPDTSRAILELKEHPPHVVVAMTTSEFAGAVIPAIEGPGQWGKSGTPSYQMLRPYYVASHKLYNTPQLRDLTTNTNFTPPLDRRLVGVNHAANLDEKSKGLYASYMAYMAAHYQPETGKGVDVEGTENHYDGAYSLLYAVTAANGSASKWDGTHVAAGLLGRVLTSVAGSQSVDIGREPIPSAVSSLSASPSYKISLWGTMGPPNFDLFTGTRKRDTSAWCIQRAGAVATYKADGLIYQPGPNPGEGTFVDNPAGVPICLQDYVDDP